MFSFCYIFPFASLSRNDSDGKLFRTAGGEPNVEPQSGLYPRGEPLSAGTALSFIFHYQYTLRFCDGGV